MLPGGVIYALKQFHKGSFEPGLMQELRKVTWPSGDKSQGVVPRSDEVYSHGPGALPMAEPGRYKGIRQAPLLELPDTPRQASSVMRWRAWPCSPPHSSGRR